MDFFWWREVRIVDIAAAFQALSIYLESKNCVDSRSKLFHLSDKLTSARIALFICSVLAALSIYMFSAFHLVLLAMSTERQAKVKNIHFTETMEKN